jgi:hypothetical protein
VELEDRVTLTRKLDEVRKWESDQNDLWFWEKLGRLPFVFLDRITPNVVRDKLGTAVDELVAFLENGGKYLVREQDIHTRFQEAFPRKDEQSLETLPINQRPLAQMDKIAAELSESRATFAAVQGATTGFGGIFTLAIDIPLLLGTSLKVLQEMAICYGYDPQDKRERLFIVKCLQFASSDIVGKQAILEELSSFDNPSKERDVLSQLQGWREVVVTYTENFGWKKLFQIVPVAGMLFGAYLNRSSVRDVAETGMMLYRKRRILERLGTEA